MANSDLQLIAGRFPRPVGRQLKVLAAERGSTVQALVGEALDLLFAKYKRPPVADLVETPNGNDDR